MNEWGRVKPPAALEMRPGRLRDGGSLIAGRAGATPRVIAERPQRSEDERPERRRRYSDSPSSRAGLSLTMVFSSSSVTPSAQRALRNSTIPSAGRGTAFVQP